MEPSKITPGPWESDDTRKYYQGHVIRCNGMVVCRMLDLGYPSHGDRQANARLIAAAPEMREELDPDSLEYVAELLARHGHTNVVVNLREKVRRERALLARIDGGSHD